MPNDRIPTGSSRSEDLRQIPQWADRYARHRVLAVLVSLVIICGAAAVIAALSAMAGVTWRKGMSGLSVALTVADVAFCVWWVWLVLSRRLNAVVGSAHRGLYRNEGEVTPTGIPVRPTVVDKVVAIAFAILVCGTPLLCDYVELPLQYLQPLTAAYVVPFMVYISIRQSACSTRLMLLWPGLYALHALLVLAGVPLLANIPTMMAVILPMSLYGLVAVLVAHLYSRYALHRLRELARSAEAGDDDGDV